MARRFDLIPLACVLAFMCTGAGRTPGAAPAPRLASTPAPTISSSTNGLLARRTAGTDSFILFGGPGTLEGKFQDASGRPDWQGWQGIDRTETPVYWQVSTHNAENLNGNGVGNKAYWCGQTYEQAPHFVHTPGYGSSWDAKLLYESGPVADPSVGQTLSLDFFFNIDTEPGYDFLMVEVDSAGTWQQLNPHYTFDGTNRDASSVFQVPGLRFSDLSPSTYEFTGNDYGGENADRVRVRIRFRSDGAFDDESGLWPTVGGACQIDDITLTHDGASFFEDFEGPGPWLFQPVLEPFVGDFSDLFVGLKELDPYRENRTPVAAFIDYGQEPRNGPNVDGTASTGGSTSPNWSYGLSSGYVVNHTGGLSPTLAADPLFNQIWSPMIQWDLPGTEDDGVEVVGAVLGFDVYNHLPLANGLFYEWYVGPARGGDFQNDRFVYYSADGPLWERRTIDVTGYVRPHSYPELRIALGVQDYAVLFGFPGGDATPAPYFDNVRLTKYRLDGPPITAPWFGAFNQVWPSTPGPIDVSTPAGRDALDIYLAGSVEVDDSAIYGSRVTDVRMFWALKKNPVFEDAIRVVPSSSGDQNVVTGPEIWTGQVVNSDSWSDTRDFSGLLWRAFYPGDRIEYYVRVSDDDGRVSTLPADLTGFGSFDGSYDPRFTVRGLPSIHDTTGAQASILVYAGGGPLADAPLIRDSLAQLGFVEGIEYDVFVRTGNYSPMLAEVATLDLMAGYDTILFFGGGGSDHEYESLLEYFGATGLPRWKGLDSDTATLLTSWSALPGDRSMVLFGSLLGFSLANDTGQAPTFLASQLGVQLVADDLRPVIGGQASPLVEPLGSGFSTPFAVSGSGRKFAALDHLEPIAPAVRGHAFGLPGGSAHPTAAASILKVETVGTDRKVHLTFPYAFQFIQAPVSRANPMASARAKLLEEALIAAGLVLTPAIPTSAPVVHRAAMSIRPNPFNPQTTVALSLPASGQASVRVFDVRGRLVRTLHEGSLEAGPHDLTWDGRDDRGAVLASGVYLVRATWPGGELKQKALLVK